MATNMSAPTFEGIIQHHKLSSSQVQAVVPDEVLHSLAKKMTRWQSIAADLKVDKIDVEAIEKEKIDEEVKGRKLLERWKESFGHAATIELLTRCLIRSKRVDLADLLCGECKNWTPCPADGSLAPEKEKPSLPKVIALAIPQGVGDVYWTFGTLLLNDKTSSVMRTIEREFHHNTFRINLKILQDWLLGKGEPVTWQTLIQTLHTCKLTDLADRIQRECL